VTLALSRVEPVTRSWVELMAPAVELAKAIAGTQFVPAALRRDPAAIAAAILYGDEIGVGPMQSLATIAVIDGRPFVAAQTQRALVLAKGHDLWLDEATNSRATWAGRRTGGDQVTRITWTLDDARRARLDGKPNWRAYPRAMLSARASAELVRAVFADVVGGLAAIEELEEFDAGLVGLSTAPAVDGTLGPAPAGRRSRAPRRAARATPAGPAVEAAVERRRPPLSREVEAAGEHDTARDGARLAATAPANTEPVAAITPAQRNRMHALFRRHEVADRAERLRLSSGWIGREVGSANELTSAEADRLIDVLEHLGDVDEVEAPVGDPPGDVGPTWRRPVEPDEPVAPPAEDVPLPLDEQAP